MKSRIQNLFITFALLAGVHQAAAQGTTAFTYQGQLHDGGTNANGPYTMSFALYDASTIGNQIGGTITTSPTLANGLFSVNLDFGAGAFNGAARWLDITVTIGATTQTLSPRVQLLPAPYAQFATVAATVTNGAIMNAQLAGYAVNTTNIQNGAITTTQIANGAVTNANLTANAVATINIQNGAITTAQIAVNAVATTNIQNNAITTALITNNAVTDAKIVSVSGSKVTGEVALATNLSNGTWSTKAGTYGGVFNVFGFYNNTSLVLALTPTLNAYFNTPLEVNGYLQVDNGLYISGGADISPDGSGSDVFDGPISALSISTSNGANIGANINSDGSAFFNGPISAPAFNTSSDRNLKEKFTPIDNQQILERVASLPISSWNFKQDANTRHIGPMAQDFYAAFNVGMDDKHIATVDEDGVALAAIQGLNEKLKAELNRQDTENAKLKQQNDLLAQRLNELEAAVKVLAEKK